jgi:hypothetical protein
MDCVYRDRCRKYNPGYPDCEAERLDLEDASLCPWYRHFERSDWNWFEPMTPLERDEINFW